MTMGMRNRHRERCGCKGHGPGLKDSGTCICLACGARVPHQPGIPCREVSCPRCGQFMRREWPEATESPSPEVQPQ